MITHSIIIQKFIEAALELDVHFTIPHNENLLAEVLSSSREITEENGEYFGGVIEKGTNNDAFAGISKILLQDILPIIRKRGWFGIGGVDVLVDTDGKFYFSDFNCRMTATRTQAIQSKSGLLPGKSIAVFNGEFKGDLDKFRHQMISHARHGASKHVLNVPKGKI